MEGLQADSGYRPAVDSVQDILSSINLNPKQVYLVVNCKTFNS